MNKKPRETLGCLLWLNKARRRRQDLLERIVSVCPEFAATFVDAEMSAELARRFRRKADAAPRKRVQCFDNCVPYLQLSQWPFDEIVFLHREYRDTGVMLCSPSQLLPNACALRELLEPDFEVMARDGESGIAYEEDEYESFVRVWGKPGELKGASEAERAKQE